jgi:catechol 2,3-dioxygenase-like lactoylglutathione lyase family enzyme
MIRTLGLSHINLNVASVERSMLFYRDVFGLELLHDYQGPIGSRPSGRQVVLSTPGANDLLALTQAPGNPIGRGGVSHFGFTLACDDDLDEAVAEVERAGGHLVRRGSAEIDSIIERFAYLEDPDGYVFELNAQRVCLGRKQSQGKQR